MIASRRRSFKLSSNQSIMTTTHKGTAAMKWLLPCTSVCVCMVYMWLKTLLCVCGEGCGRND